MKRRRGSKFRYSENFTSSPTASHSAAGRARSVKADCLFFALSQRIGEDMVGFSNKDTSEVQFAHLEEFCKQNSSHRKFNFILGLMPLRNPQNLLLSISAARGGYMARDSFRRAGALRSRFDPLLAEQRYARVQRASNARVSRRKPRCEERQCQGRSKGEHLGFLLGYFLGNAKK